MCSIILVFRYIGSLLVLASDFISWTKHTRAVVEEGCGGSCSLHGGEDKPLLRRTEVYQQRSASVLCICFLSVLPNWRLSS